MIEQYARFTDPDHTRGEFLRLSGDLVAGPMPPTAGDIRFEFDIWKAAGGVEQPYLPPAVDLISYAKDASWRKEVGGIAFAGIQIATDDRSKLMITGARVAAMSDPNWTTRWDAADETTHEINAPTMIAISEAVSAHVNNCFAIRATVKAGIADGSITTTAQIDAAFA